MSNLIRQAESRRLNQRLEEESRARRNAEYDAAMEELDAAEERAKLPGGGGYAELERIKNAREELVKMRDEEFGEPTYPMEDY